MKWLSLPLFFIEYDGGGRGEWLAAVNGCSGNGSCGVGAPAERCVEFDSRLQVVNVVFGLFAVGLSVLTALGNGFVVLAICCNRRLNRKKTNLLILNLAVADLMVGVSIMPLSASMVFTNGQWIFGRPMCRLWTSLDVVCCTASIQTLCVISIDRFVGVTKPLRYQVLVTRRRLMCANVVVWLLSVGILMLTVRWSRADYCQFECHVGNELEYVVQSTVFSFFIPLAVILAVYYQIYRVTQRRQLSLLRSIMLSAATGNSYGTIRSGRYFGNRAFSLRVFAPLRMHVGGTETAFAKKRRQLDKQTNRAKTLAIVVGVFLFCWIPFFIFYLVETFCDRCVPEAVMTVCTWLGYGNSLINPLIYALSMRAFGKAFQSLLMRRNTSSSSSMHTWKRQFTSTKHHLSTRAVQVQFGNKLFDDTCNLTSSRCCSDFSTALALVNGYPCVDKTYYDTAPAQLPLSNSVITLKVYTHMVNSKVTDL